MSPVRIDLTALGLTLSIAMMVAYPKMRGLSHGIFEKWATKKDVARVELEDLAIQTLIQLQLDLNDALGAGVDHGPDYRYTVDPSKFRPAIEKSARLYSIKNGLERSYLRCRKFAKAAPHALEFMFVSFIWFFVRAAWQRNWPGWSILSSWLLPVLALIVSLFVASGYFTYEKRLQVAVETATEGKRDEHTDQSS